MNIRNYTSDVPAEKSISRIEAKLVEAGAQNITKSYSADKKLAELFFDLPDSTDVKILRPVRLPANAERIYEILMKEVRRERSGTREKIQEQSIRTAWKLLYDWVDVQCSLIALGQVEPMEVFMPYLYNYRTKQTLFEIARNTHFRNLLPAPAGD